MKTTWLPTVVIQAQLGVREGVRDIDQASLGKWGVVLRKVVMCRGREGLRLEWQPSLTLELESRATEQKPNKRAGPGRVG